MRWEQQQRVRYATLCCVNTCTQRETLVKQDRAVAGKVRELADRPQPWPVSTQGALPDRPAVSQLLKQCSQSQLCNPAGYQDILARHVTGTSLQQAPDTTCLPNRPSQLGRHACGLVLRLRHLQQLLPWSMQVRAALVAASLQHCLSVHWGSVVPDSCCLQQHPSFACNQTTGVLCRFCSCCRHGQDRPLPVRQLPGKLVGSGYPHCWCGLAHGDVPDWGACLHVTVPSSTLLPAGTTGTVHS